MDINEITKIQWDKFAKNLQEYYNNEDYLFTEDLIRYWFIKFFKSIDATRSKINTEIEVPYLRGSATKLKLKHKCPIQLKLKNTKNRSRADLYYNNNDEVVEFKFNRGTKYSKNCTGSDLGSLLNDFNRLSILDNKNKYSIYICDEYMKNYLSKKHKNNFPILDYENKSIQQYRYSEDYYNLKNFKDILKHAFFSFLDAKDFDTKRYLFDLKKFNYEIKLLYKKGIQNKSSNKSIYLFVFKII